MGFWRDLFIGPEPLATASAAAESAALEVRATGTGITPPSRTATGTVTVDQALSIGAVYRAVNIIVTSVAQMDLRVLRGGVEIPTPALVKSPNVNDTRAAFIEETVFSLAAHGNAFWLLTRDAATVQSIRVLDPRLVGVNLDPETGKVTYSFNGNTVPASRLKHLKLTRRPGEALGLGPIQAAKGELTGALRLREFSDGWFDTHNMPTGALTTDQPLSPEESAEFAAAWKRFLADTEGIAVLSQGLGYSPIQIDPAKAQYIEVQKASVTAIARLFGVPSTYLLADQGTTNTYVNQQELNLIFLQTTLTRYCTEIENALSDLLPRGQVVAFAEDDLLRMNSKLRTDIDVKVVQAGLRTVNELRARDHLTPVPWGDDKPAAVASPGSEQGATDDPQEAAA